MATIFTKMTKPQKIGTLIFFTVIVTSMIFVAYSLGGVQYAILGIVGVFGTVGILTAYTKLYRPKISLNLVGIYHHHVGPKLSHCA